MEKNIYADHSATTYVDKEVLEEMLPYFTEKYGNASSLYNKGIEARKAVENAREKIAKVIGCKRDEIYFTSGGSEADNLILKGICYANKAKGNHIITSKIEHMAILNTCKALEQEGFEVTYLDVNQNGFVDVEDVRKAIKDTTILVSIMFANNEIGTIQPIKEIGEITKFKSITFHTDAVQVVGNKKIDVQELNIDCLSMSAHKFYGPKGIGAAYIKKGIDFLPQIYGGHQEKNKRAGTENVPAIVGMGKAIEVANSNIEENIKQVQTVRDYVLDRLLVLPNIDLNGSREDRLCGNINICVKGIEAEALLVMLDMKGIAVSAGSACNSNSLNPSHVLKAIGLSSTDALCSIRLTFGKCNTIEEGEYIVNVLKEIIQQTLSK